MDNFKITFLITSIITIISVWCVVLSFASLWDVPLLKCPEGQIRIHSGECVRLFTINFYDPSHSKQSASLTPEKTVEENEEKLVELLKWLSISAADTDYEYEY